jgi:hypothetical protein
VDPKPPCLVATGGNDSPSFGIATDDDRQTAKLRLVALLYRRKEGIHVHMDDLAEIRVTLWY